MSLQSKKPSEFIPQLPQMQTYFLLRSEADLKRIKDICSNVGIEFDTTFKVAKAETKLPLIIIVYKDDVPEEVKLRLNNVLKEGDSCGTY